mmetsp:Transcript_13555/g.17587  ORF Transcript_13555/g.17587 Transcript_13555/m.17587 type:complete len:651 (-) Transcript_13555:104-2056(-)
MKMKTEMESVCGSIRDCAAKVVNTKLSNKEEEKNKILKTLGKDLAFYLTELRRLSRDSFMVQDDFREEIEKMKSKVENEHLQLQNLLYEKAYLLREIHRCRAFDLTETKKIELISLQEFKNKAEVSLSEETDPHALQMNRLSYELQQRKQLLDDLKLKKVEKVKVQESTANQKSFIGEIPSKLDAVEKATQGLQEYFGSNISKRMQRHQLCRQLPTPLYVIYSQLEAYGDAFGGVTMKVEETTADIDNGSKEDDNGKSKKRPMDSDLKSPSKRKKRSKRSVSPAAHDEDTEEEEEAEQQLDVYKAHPHTVRARLRSKQGVDVMLRFELLEALDVVTVTAEAHQALLANLFPNDTGVFLPRTVAKYTETQERNTIFPSHLKGRPYKWAQWLAGLTYLDPSMPNHSQPSTREIVENVLTRVRAQEALSAQLEVLGKCPHPVDVHVKAKVLFPQTAVAKLVKWEEVTENENAVAFLKLSRPRCLAPVMHMHSQPNTQKKEDNQDKSSRSWSDFGRRLFRGEFETSGKAGYPKTIQVVVQVFVDYPARAPYFTLLTESNSVANINDSKANPNYSVASQEFRTIQAEVNAYANELRAGDPLNLLSHQLRRLQMCLDVLTGDIEKSSQQSFGRTKRGRDRKLAFVFDPISQKFRHR